MKPGLISQAGPAARKLLSWWAACMEVQPGWRRRSFRGSRTQACLLWKLTWHGQIFRMSFRTAAAPGVVVAAPTYEGELFPPMADVLRMAAQKRIRGRLSAWVGSYGWKSAAPSHYEELIRPMRWKHFDGHEFKGAPGQDDLAAGTALGRRFAEAVRSQHKLSG